MFTIIFYNTFVSAKSVSVFKILKNTNIALSSESIIVLHFIFFF